MQTLLVGFSGSGLIRVCASRCSSGRTFCRTTTPCLHKRRLQLGGLQATSLQKTRRHVLHLGFDSTMFCYGAYDQVPAPCNRIGRVRVTHSSYNGQSLRYSSVTPSATAPLHLRYSSTPAPLQLRYTLRYSSVTRSVTAPLQLRYTLRYSSATAPLQLRYTLRYSSVTASVTAPLQLRYTLRYSSVAPSVTAPLQLRYTLRYSSVTVRYSSVTAPLPLRYSSVTAPLQLRYSSVAPSVTAPLQPLLQLRDSSVTLPSVTPPSIPKSVTDRVPDVPKSCNREGPG